MIFISDVIFKGSPWFLTLVGQYIIKNLVVVSALFTIFPMKEIEISKKEKKFSLLKLHVSLDNCIDYFLLTFKTVFLKKNINNDYPFSSEKKRVMLKRLKNKNIAIKGKQIIEELTSLSSTLF